MTRQEAIERAASEFKNYAIYNSSTARAVRVKATVAHRLGATKRELAHAVELALNGYSFKLADVKVFKREVWD